MKNIPLFTTAAGVASLVLEQIAYNKTAYIRLQSSDEPLKLVRDCVDFCKAVGAESVYVSGNKVPELFGISTSVVRMSRSRSGLRKSGAKLVAVTPENLEEFRRIYNDAMYHVPNASGLTMQAAENLMEDGTGYFVFGKQELLGIGVAEGNEIYVVVSLIPGMGETILQSLNSVLVGDTVHVEVSDSNTSAMRLYTRMGFTVTEIISQWFKIF